MSIPIAHVGTGVLDPVQFLSLAVLTFAYARRARTLARAGRPVAVARQFSFLGGIVVILLALASPLGHLNEELFLAHMAQHLLLADVGGLLLVLGLTGPLLQPLLAIRVIGRLRALTHPLIALPLWLVNLYVWHLPALYQATLTSDVAHGLQHASFVGFGILVWMPLFGPLPKPAWFGDWLQLAYVVGFRFAGAVLGNVLIWSGSAIYPDYAAGEAVWGLEPLADQSIGGAIMMFENLVLTVGVAIAILIRYSKQDEAAQQLVDDAAEMGAEVDYQRARRAVRAGRADELRERLSLRARETRFARAGGASATWDQ